MPWAFSTRTAPSSPIPSTISPIISAIFSSRTVPRTIRAISSCSSIGRAWAASSARATSIACSMPRRMPTGLAPAAIIRTASAISRVAITAAVVAPSPTVSWTRQATWRMTIAPMLSKGSVSSMVRRAIVAPSSRISGCPFSSDATATVRATGPRVGRSSLVICSMPRRRVVLAASPYSIAVGGFRLGGGTVASAGP